MQRIFLALPFAALFFFSPPDVFATPLVDNSCQGISCNTDNSVNNTATGGTGGNGGAGGTATNANAISNTATNRNDVDVNTIDLNTNYNLTHQKQKQGQAQLQGQDQDQHQKIDDSGNSSIDWNAPRNTAGAYAGSAAIASDSCGSSVGAGGQGPAFGFSFNFARDDETCELIKLSRTLREYGDPASAIALLCQDERVYKARLAIGQPCPKVED